MHTDVLSKHYLIFCWNMRWKHNPPCESLQAELLHGVIEWSAGVFADRGALGAKILIWVISCYPYENQLQKKIAKFAFLYTYTLHTRINYARKSLPITSHRSAGTLFRRSPLLQHRYRNPRRKRRHLVILSVILRSLAT